jgi:hypothetical protein
MGEQPWPGIRTVITKEESAIGPQVIGMGCAGAALDAAVHFVRTRGMHEWMLQKLAPMIARLNALRCFHLVASRNMYGDFEPTVRMQVELKTMGGGEPYQMCDEVMEIMGGSSLMRSSPIQRYYRDARTAAYLMLPMESRRERVGIHNCERDAALEKQDQPTMEWEAHADQAFRLSRGRFDVDPTFPDDILSRLSRAAVEELARSKGETFVSLGTYVEQLFAVTPAIGEYMRSRAGQPVGRAAGSPLGTRRG